jgi:hypothetical protein
MLLHAMWGANTVVFLIFNLWWLGIYNYDTYSMGIFQTLTLRRLAELLTVQEIKEFSFLKSPHCNNSTKTASWWNYNNKIKANICQVFINHHLEEWQESYIFEFTGQEHHRINFTALVCFYFPTGRALSQPHYAMWV